MAENNVDKYRLPEKETLEHASKIAITQDKPIMFDYWCSSLDGGILIGVRDTGEKLLVKNEDEYTSPIAKIYKVQIGAFGKLKNANNYLDKIEIIDFKKIKFSIEEDLSSGLFRIKSINSFSKDQGEKVCKNYRKVKVNCILSKI